jgi:arylsulfatase A-like enzyme/Flp pilus assembly protein TadD
MADWMTVLTLAAVTLVCGCTERPAPAPPPRVATNVLIITVDTLRADRVGIYGATNIETPNMDRLAHEGAWAPQSDAPVPLTRPSHVSLFTGRYPSEHGIRDNLSAPLNADVPLLSGIFQQAGFATAAFVASSVLDRQSGLARGFDVYSDRFGGADQRTGDVVTAEAIGWLRSPPKPKFFAWVHLYDPHAPYTPPEPYASRYAGRLYDGEVAWCDELVGRIVTALREAGTLDNTLVILTSDHGEALGEHGEDVHGYFVYEATLRVPLIVRGPGVAPGTRLGTLTRTIDLFPTVLDLMGVRADQPSSGRSLGPALRGGIVPDEPAFAESLVPLLHYGWSDLRSLRDGRWKYILAPRPELYDLEADPGELRNLATEQDSRARAMRSGLESQLGNERSSPKSADASGISPEALERLGALGYVSPGGSIDKKSAGADPKDKLEEYKALSGLMQQALVAMRGGRSAEAVQHLREVARRGLDSYEVHFYLGRALAAGNQWRDAALEYERATKKFPAGVEAWRGIGESRVALQDSRGAVHAFETLVSLAPQDPVALMQLGETYRDLGRWDDATRTIQRALVIDPGPAQYWNSFGTVLGSAGKMSEAEHAFGEAVRREPTNGLYRYNHGVALQQLGRRDEAMTEFQQAQALGYRGQ